MTTRRPAVAGLFYPQDAGELARAVDGHLESARGPVLNAPPKALIAPHAGYLYSGPVAGSAFAALRPAAQRIARVVLLGPSHFVPFSGLALDPAEAFLTPLGEIPIDREAVSRLRTRPRVEVLEAAHLREHSLEVELPFLQRVLEGFTLVPLVTGEITAEESGEILDELWGDNETLVVVSSDLSHYLDYESAEVVDEETARLVAAVEPTTLRPDQACGCHAINALLHVARRRGLAGTILDLRSSGDTAGGRDQVVGYGAFAFA
jgi:hypothetical protein